MARRTKEEAQETRENLLNAALEVFCEKGFSRTRLSDVAERIGMTRGAFYWHFKDKTSLLAGLLTKMRDREETLVRMQVPELETLEDLQAHFTARARVLIEDETCHKIVFFLTQQVEWSVEMREAVHREVCHLRERPFAEITHTLQKAHDAGQLRPGTNVDEVADILIGLYMGLAGNYMRNFLHSDFERAVASGFSTVLHAISIPANENKSGREAEVQASKETCE